MHMTLYGVCGSVNRPMVVISVMQKKVREVRSRESGEKSHSFRHDAEVAVTLKRSIWQCDASMLYHASREEKQAACHLHDMLADVGSTEEMITNKDRRLDANSSRGRASESAQC